MELYVVVYESGKLALGFPNKVRAYDNESQAKATATRFTRRSRGDHKFRVVKYVPFE
jgi:hypothetical protein